MTHLQQDELASVVPSVDPRVAMADTRTQEQPFVMSLLPGLAEAETVASDVLLDPESIAVVEAVTTVAAVAEDAANRVSAALQQSLKSLKSELRNAVMQVRSTVTQRGAQSAEEKSHEQTVLVAAQVLPGMIPNGLANANTDRISTRFDADFDIDAIAKEVEDGQAVEVIPKVQDAGIAEIASDKQTSNRHHAVPPIPPESLLVDSSLQNDHPVKTADVDDHLKPALQSAKLHDRNDDDELKIPRTAVVLHGVGITAEEIPTRGYADELHFKQNRSAKSHTPYRLDSDDDEVRRNKGVFIDSSKVKEDVKRSLMQPVYRVTDFYKTIGFPQMICRNQKFDNCVLAVIVFNGLWLGIDTEYNDAAVILDAHPVFIVADQFFCLFFTTELVLRYLAFERKRDCCNDKWFVFDSFLVTFMALESWILNGILLVSGHNTSTSQGFLQNTSLLRLFRLLRLSRLCRLAKLMRAMPEIMIIMKGLFASIRTVFFTLLLLVFLVYVFAVAFTTMAKGTEMGDEYFNSVYRSIFTFFVLGAFPDLYDPLQTMVDEGIIYFFAFLVYGVLATVSIMNMMIGVLVDVVNATSEVERESMDVEFLRDMLLQELDTLDMCDISDPSKIILDKTQVFEMLSTPLAAQSLSAVGVDVIAFLELLEYVFTMCTQLSFPAFVETALQFRSSKFALVKDIVDLRRYLKYEMEQIVDLLHQFNGKGSSHRSNSGNPPSAENSSYVRPLRTLHDLVPA